MIPMIESLLMFVVVVLSVVILCAVLMAVYN